VTFRGSGVADPRAETHFRLLTVTTGVLVSDEDVHVYPGDTATHDRGVDCWCGPSVDERGDGEAWRVVVHRPLDGGGEVAR